MAYSTAKGEQVQETAACPDCGGDLIFMEEKKKFWCPVCGGIRIPRLEDGVLPEDMSGRKERVIHGYFDDVKIKDANPLAFYGIIILVIAATLSLFWFSYMHNPLGIPEAYKGHDVYLGFGPTDSMLGYIGWLVVLGGMVVIGALLWFRDPQSHTTEAERSHKLFRYGVVASLTGMGAFSLSTMLNNQMVEKEANLGIDTPPYFAIALVPGIILVLCGIVLFVMAHRIQKESDLRDSRALYFEDIGLTVTGDCPECGFPTELQSDECDNCGALLVPVDFEVVRDEMLRDRETIEEPLKDVSGPLIIPQEEGETEVEGVEGKLPEDYGVAEPEFDIVDEIIEDEIIEGMDSAETEHVNGEQELVDELIEQAFLEEISEEPAADEAAEAAEVPKICDSCGQPLTYIDQYDAWYCYDCEKYEGE